MLHPRLSKEQHASLKDKVTYDYIQVIHFPRNGDELQLSMKSADLKTTRKSKKIGTK